jgi:glycerate kinase
MINDLVSQADLIIFGEGVKEEDHLLETTTLTIAELVCIPILKSVYLSGISTKVLNIAVTWY